MRLAAIDIGTNSVHMIVVRVRPDFSFEIIDREKEMVRLGAGGLDGRKLTDTAMDAALQALSKFRRLAESHQVDEILAAATSATREAENGVQFLAAIQQRTGIRARVISGTEEARLIHLAAVYGVDVKRGKAASSISAAAASKSRSAASGRSTRRASRSASSASPSGSSKSDPLTRARRAQARRPHPTRDRRVHRSRSPKRATTA